jgi:mannose-1-phosphate guanylyltransferase
MKPVVMILAAGLGTRLAPFTDHTPKPLLPVLDVPLIEIGIRRLLAAGLRRFVVNSHHLCELLEAFLADLRSRLSVELKNDGGEQLEIMISREPELLGTGGGLARARVLFQDQPVLVVNSDVMFDFDLEQLVTFHESRGALATVLLHDGTGCEHLRSTATDSRGRITAIGRASAEQTERAVFSGIYLLEPALYGCLPNRFCSVITEGLKPAMESGARVLGLRASFPWRDLGTWEEYRAAVVDFLSNPIVSPYGQLKDLLPGRLIPDSVGTGFSYVGPGVEIPEGSTLGPLAAVGAHVRLASGCRLERSVVLPGAEVSGRFSDTVCGL